MVLQRCRAGQTPALPLPHSRRAALTEETAQEHLRLLGAAGEHLQILQESSQQPRTHQSHVLDRAR